MGWLVKIWFPYHTLTVRPGLGLYIYHVMMSRTSDDDTVRPLCRPSGRTSFSLYCLPILPLLGLLETP